MKIHIPIGLIIYQEIDVPNDLSIDTYEFQNMNIPIPNKLPKEVFDSFSDQLAISPVFSSFLTLLYNLRKECSYKAEISPCVGNIEFKEAN